MARRSRVELNRSRLDEVRGGLADGVFDLVRAIGVVASNNAPDSPYEPYPTGKGLPEQIGAMVYVDGKRTAEWSADGQRRPDLPKGQQVRARGGIIGIVGAGFPGLFNETGTVNMHAQPFLTPAANDVIGSEAPVILSKAMARRLSGLRSTNTAKIRARIAAARGGT